MKKYLLLVLIMALTFSFVGCSSGSKSETPKGSTGSPAAESSKVAFPEKNMKIIVPFAPGGAVDVTCRFFAELAPKYFDNKSIIVENMEGGGAVVGQNAGAKANPDGYSILAFTSSVVTNPLTKQTDYTQESFKPVVMYCDDPEVLVVSAKSPIKTLEEFIAAGKEKPISVCTPGKSTSHHIAGLILQDKTNVKLNFLHNNGAAMQITQILGGHVQAGLMAFGEAKGQILDGSIRVLGIMSDTRKEEIKDIPTFKEKGIDIVYGAWRGLAVPAKTPKEVVAALEKGFEGIVKDQQFIDKMNKAGYPLVYKNSADFSKYVAQNAEDMKKVIPLLNK